MCARIFAQRLTVTRFTGRLLFMFDAKQVDFFDLDEEDFDTVITDDIQFTGIVRFKKPFLVKGIVRGTIDATSELVVDTGATVEADIRASKILIKGTVTGNIIADEIVHVSATGSVTGDISARQIVLENGCFFSGKCTMVKE